MDALPEKWKLRLATREINDAVNSISLWRNGKLYWEDNYYYTSYYIFSDGNYGKYDYSGFKEISFEDFKKFVLNKNRMCKEKTIKLSLEQARKMYKKSPEMDELLLANFTKNELEIPVFPQKIEDLNPFGGFYIHSGTGRVFESLNRFNPKKDINFHHIFATEKQAKSALAMAQLSQLMKVYNGDWEPDWVNSREIKYTISRINNEISQTEAWNSYKFLAFKSAELRDEFAKNFQHLIKQYLMID